MHVQDITNGPAVRCKTWGLKGDPEKARFERAVNGKFIRVIKSSLGTRVFYPWRKPSLVFPPLTVSPRLILFRGRPTLGPRSLGRWRWGSGTMTAFTFPFTWTMTVISRTSGKSGEKIFWFDPTTNGRTFCSRSRSPISIRQAFVWPRCLLSLPKCRRYKVQVYCSR